MMKQSADKRLRYIQVAVPLRISWNPFYSTEDESLSVGDRVKVQMMGRILNAVVTAVDVRPDIEAKRILPVLSIEQGLPKITEKEIRLWTFISSYYMCPMGEVLRCAYPDGKVRSEEIAVAGRERERLRRLREEDARQKKIQRLRQRLEKKEAELGCRHNETVTLRLRGEKEALEQEIAVLLAAQAANGGTPSAPEVLPVIATPEKSEKPEEPNVQNPDLDGRPLLLKGENRDRETVYSKLIRSELDTGRSVLVLTPETVRGRELEKTISVSAGDRMLSVSVTDSFAVRQKVVEEVRNGGPWVVVGTCPAIFLPFRELGLVIIDEEQDISFKQELRMPYYNGRDTAVLLAGIHGARTVLGSATPSLETLYNALTGKYSQQLLPSSSSGKVSVEIIDVSAERRKNGMVGQLSRKLIEAVKITFAAGRRSLLITAWNDTSALEADASVYIPEAQISNLRDARAMDFGAFGLVALIQTDTLLGGDDFRTDEKAQLLIDRFRLKCSAADSIGRFLIQTSRSDHQVYAGLNGMFQNGNTVYDRLLEERKVFGFPPYTRIVDLVVNDSNEKRLECLSSRLAVYMSAAFGTDALLGRDIRLMGPLQPAPWRYDNATRRTVRIFLKRDTSLSKRKEYIAACLESFVREHKYQGHITVDVDPL